MKPKTKKWLRRNQYYLYLGFALFLIFFPYNVFKGRHIIWVYYNEMKYNELGDFIGGITAPVLSAVAILLLFKTYRSQKKELRLTQDALKSQQASSSLFNMIGVFENIIASLTMPVMDTGLTDEVVGQKYIHGRELIAYEYLQLKILLRDFKVHKFNLDSGLFDRYFMDSPQRTGETNTADEYEEYFSTVVDEFLASHSTIHQYLRYVESILNFIDTTFPNEDKDLQYSIFCSQFSDAELGLIYYLSMGTLKERLRTMIVKAHFLRFLLVSSLVDVDHFFIYKSRLSKMLSRVDQKSQV